jgi:hypothetical protein
LNALTAVRGTVERLVQRSWVVSQTMHVAGMPKPTGYWHYS